MLIIDADQMIFSCGFATEGEPLENTLQAVKQKIHAIMESCSHDRDETELYIKGVGNFRDDVVSDYKANRTSRKPAAYDDIVDYMVREWGATKVNGMEADDEVSRILWEDYTLHGGEQDLCEVICYSPDKDLLNTPGWHMNLKSEEPFWVSEYQAMRHFLFQMLRGDPVDNIKGLETVPKFIKDEWGLKSLRMGEAGAKKVMSRSKEITDNLADISYLYCLQDQSHTGLWKTAQLLWMARDLEPSGSPCDPSMYLDHDALERGVIRSIDEDRRTDDEREAAIARAEGLQAPATTEAEECVPSVQGEDPSRGGDP